MVPLKIKLPEHFLNEEVRCGYTVSHKMKEVWAVELDLIAEFDRVCKKYGIRYIASGGTMLGAVRHKGMIPWDDDVDLMLQRNDYNKLCEIASTEFKHPYFFQTASSDPGYPRCFAKLRNSTTTALLKSHQKYNYRFNQGIFIDVFPLDNIPDNTLLFAWQTLKANFYLKAHNLYTPFFNKAKDDRPLYKRLIAQTSYGIFRILNCRWVNPKYSMKKYEEVCCRYKDQQTVFTSLLSFRFNDRKHDIRLKDMEDTIDVDFEFLKMPIPRNYDEHLKRKYGDYMMPLNIGGYHSEIFFDTDKSYLEYIGK